MEIKQRQTAYKVWIGSLLTCKFTRGSEQFEPGYIELNNIRISRVILIGMIIDRFEGNNYVSFTLDDSSGSIRLKTWNEEVSSFSHVNVGDLVLVVAKVKEYNNQIYLSPETIRKLDNPLWLKVRKLELVNLYGEPIRVEQEYNEEIKAEENNMGVVEEKVTGSIPSSKREKVISLIEGLDKGSGVNLSDIVIGSGLEESEVNSLIEDMIKQGEIFEIQKNRLRVVG